MADLFLDVNPSDIAELRGRLDKEYKKFADKAVLRAINKAIRGGRAEQVKRISKNSGVPQNEVRKRQVLGKVRLARIDDYFAQSTIASNNIAGRSKPYEFANKNKIRYSKKTGYSVGGKKIDKSFKHPTTKKPYRRLRKTTYPIYQILKPLIDEKSLTEIDRKLINKKMNDVFFKELKRQLGL